MFNNKFYTACKKGNIELVKHITSCEDSCEDVSELYNEALRWASYFGKIEIVKFLANKGADIKNNGLAVCLALRSGHMEILKYLIDNGGTLNNEYILYASENGHIEVVKYLISKGIDFRIENDKALRWASCYGHFEIVKYLVNLGLDVTAEDNGAIRLASTFGHLEIIKYLISKGADKKIIENNERFKKYILFCEKIEQKNRLKAQKKIYYWVQEYVLSRPEVVTRMAEKSWMYSQKGEMI